MECITIVGGGSAGWISAFLLSKIRKNCHITLIESSEILSVGVGEGTTGRFLEVLMRSNLGLDLTDLLTNLKSLPKMGINFVNWTNKGNFISPIGGSATPDTYIDYAPYYCYLKSIDSSYINETEYLSKIDHSNFTKNLQGKLKYNEFYPAIHLDAGSLVKFFREKSKQNGVRHIVDTVETVNKQNENIISLTLKSLGEYKSDFYIDCTGFQRQLMHDVDWIDYSNYLPVDRGMPYRIENDTCDKHVYTNAIAMDNGWVWEIPTKEKIGRGYVFSSKYADEESCLKELKKYYKQDVEKIKTIQFSSGRLSKVLKGNCLALGLSAAFFEPLQATSIHCTLQQIDEFIFTFVYGGKINLDPISVEKYNQRCARMYDDMKDFIFVHYTGGKTNTDFWKYFTQIEYPEQVSRLLNFHNTRLLRNYDVERYHGSVGVGLWIPTLLGLGHFNPETAHKVLSSDLDYTEMDNFIQNYSSQLKSKINRNNYLSIKYL